MNNIFEKHKLEQHYIQGLDRAMHVIESEKEIKSFNTWMWCYLKWIFVVALIVIGAGVWIAEVMACVGFEQQSVEIRTVPRI